MKVATKQGKNRKVLEIFEKCVDVWCVKESHEEAGLKSEYVAGINERYKFCW